MMLHPHPGRGRWLLALAAGGAWLLTGQHLAGQAGADQAGRPHATTLAPTTSTPVQQRPVAVADRAHRRGVKQLPVVTGRPRSDAAVAAADLLPRGLGVLAA